MQKYTLRKQKEVNTYSLNSPACVSAAAGWGIMLPGWRKDS